MGKLIAIIIILFSLSTSHAQVSKPIAAPMGWNSFCSYGVYLNQDDAIKQIEQLAKRYKKYGYNHFIIDAGWFGEFNMQKGTLIPAERHARDVHINEFGLLQPSNCYFSNGLKVLADLCHRKGLKFGIHIMRGIPRKAYEENCKIYATNYTARDIADTVHTCKWNHQNYGVNMSKHGSQEFYNSLINQIASWGVDFLKVDDIVAYPKEIKAIVDAINQCGREITLSLSPGDNVDIKNVDLFKQANMLRVTHDIWDDMIGINSCFKAWRKWQGSHEQHFFIDMDMISFGELQKLSIKRDSSVVRREDEKLSNIELLSGKGYHRQCLLTREQQRTFITLRAMTASPLMIGGDLISMDSYSFMLLTKKEMIRCNQNGITGKLIWEHNDCEGWQTEEKNCSNGWIAIFNRSDQTREISINDETLGLNLSKYYIKDIWANKKINENDLISLKANDTIFMRYKAKNK